MVRCPANLAISTEVPDAKLLLTIISSFTVDCMVPTASLWAAGSLAAAATLGLAGAAHADPNPPSPLPVFSPAPSDWSPNVDIWPYNTFTYRVTPRWSAACRTPVSGSTRSSIR